MMQGLTSTMSLFRAMTIALMCKNAFGAEKMLETNLLGCISQEEADSMGDLFPHKVETLHSEQWEISYHNTYKIIKNTHVGTNYLLYQCGTTPPETVLDEDGTEMEFNSVISVPIQDIGITQTTDIPHVELLGKRSDITYIGDPQWISSSCLNQMIDDGSVQVVDDSNAGAVDTWIEEHPDSIILANAWTDPSLPHRMILSETHETSGNKAVFEWHKVFAALYNLEHKGNQIVDETRERYECVSGNAALLQSDRVKPKLLWAYHINYYDAWSDTTTIGWQLGNCPNYYCTLAQDCSADFMQPTPEQEGSIDCWGQKCMTDTEFKAFAKDAEYWIYTGFNFNDVYDEKKDMLDELPVIQNRVVYDVRGSGPNSWFEQRMAEYGESSNYFHTFLIFHFVPILTILSFHFILILPKFTHRRCPTRYVRCCWSITREQHP